MGDNPLIGPPPDEVPLPDAPLAKVIAQVRFPPILSIQNGTFIAPFQEAIRGEYGVASVEVGAQVVASAAVPVQPRAMWRFRDPSHPWRASLGVDFVALETSAYTSRDDFVARLGRLLDALQCHVEPSVYQRLGVRYVDRVVGEPCVSLQDFVHPSLFGAMPPSWRASGAFDFHEAVVAIPEEGGQLHARWGLLPAHATHDPTAVAGGPEPSWILDLDAYMECERRFDAAEIAASATALARRIYTVFRWSVTDRFLAHYGGRP